MRIHIANGHIIDPANNVDETGDVYIADGEILSVLKKPSGFSADQKIDASGKLVTPGFVDLSARFREPGHEHKATIASEAAAAARAGVTTICCPPDTLPVIDTPAVVELIHQRIQTINKTRIYPLAAVTHALAGERLADMHTLKQAGCVGVSNADKPIENTEVLRRALEYAASYDLTVHLRPEDHYLRNNGVMHEGIISTRLGLPPVPATTETIAVSKIILLAEQTGARIHFCRLSCAKSVELVAAAKQTGLPVSADVSLCHLHLTEMDVDNYNTYCYLTPPLRTAQDSEALRTGVSDGTIDAICSDHQPHDDDAKSAPFSETEPGASTIEQLFPLAYAMVKDGSLSLLQAIAAITHNPANILGLNHGNLSVGTKADVVIIDAENEWTVTEESIASAGKNCPFIGRKLIGKVTHTLLDGKIIYSDI